MKESIYIKGSCFLTKRYRFGFDDNPLNGGGLQLKDNFGSSYLLIDKIFENTSYQTVLNQAVIYRDGLNEDHADYIQMIKLWYYNANSNDTISFSF